MPPFQQQLYHFSFNLSLRNTRDGVAL